MKAFIMYPYSKTQKLMEIECDECSEKLNDNAELAIHQRQRHQKSYCGACRKELANQKELIKHVKDTHGITIPSNNPD
jgi:Zinc finger, C2H2 type